MPRTFSAFARPYLLLPLAALLAVLPLLLHGDSCGHDLGFHLLSWFDAAAQLRHGLYPHWTVSAAWNAGEPRFVFYPPLSWLLGALLTQIMPPAAAPIAYIYLVLLAAGVAMVHCVRSLGHGFGVDEATARNAALPAAVLYLANPYMLFNAFERSAMAELLAAAWMPLLLLAVLRPRPTARGIALPIALLWLTNAPAAVMGCYLFALLATLRVLRELIARRIHALRLALTCLAGAALGLALPGFYLVPAAYERRYVQVAMAVIQNLRFQDNFLFDRTTDAAHNVVNATVSRLAVTLLAATALALGTLLLQVLRHRRNSPIEASPQDPRLTLALTLALVAALIAFLLLPLSTPLWNTLPEFAFLQFPWRLLTVLTPVLALTVALLLAPLYHADDARTPRPSRTLAWSPLLALLLPLALAFPAWRLYAQGCDPADMPGFIAGLVANHHGVPPTDEYTPTAADNDVLRTADPGYWLAPSIAPEAAAAAAPHTVPNPAQLIPNFDGEIPLDQTLSTPAPRHLELSLPRPETLILNLRDYPAWRLTLAVPGYPERAPLLPAHLQRDDGLLAVVVPAGHWRLDVRWQRTPDQQWGLALSLCGLAALGLAFWTRGSL